MDTVIFIPKTDTSFSELFIRVNYLVIGIWNLYHADCTLLLSSA